jgi:hypothetical protein
MSPLSRLDELHRSSLHPQALGAVTGIAGDTFGCDLFRIRGDNAEKITAHRKVALLLIAMFVTKLTIAVKALLIVQ